MLSRVQAPKSEAVTLRDFAIEEQRMFWNLSATSPLRRVRAFLLGAVCVACAAIAMQALRAPSSGPVIDTTPVAAPVYVRAPN